MGLSRRTASYKHTVFPGSKGTMEGIDHTLKREKLNTFIPNHLDLPNKKWYKKIKVVQLGLHEDWQKNPEPRITVPLHLIPIVMPCKYSSALHPRSRCPIFVSTVMISNNLNPSEKRIHKACQFNTVRIMYFSWHTQQGSYLKPILSKSLLVTGMSFYVSGSHI